MYISPLFLNIGQIGLDTLTQFTHRQCGFFLYGIFKLKLLPTKRINMVALGTGMFKVAWYI